MERLQKVIAASGYTSRRNAEELIKMGKVYVNGNLVTELGTKVSDSDIITVEGKTLENNSIKLYFALNKPREVLSTVSDDKDRKTVIDILDIEERVYPIGRLDYDTTGLILLTNDGKLTNKLTHPKNKIYKTYIAKINGIMVEEDYKRIRKGILIDDRKLIVDNLKVRKIDKIKNTSLIEITIHEGRNHIIRKFFETLGYDVKKLTRVSFAGIELGTLKSGEFRELTKREVEYLYNLK